MGGENLDAILEPVAEILILILVLIAVAAVSIFFINKFAARHRDRAHQKVSASKRTKHTQVDLLGGSSAAREKSENRRGDRPGTGSGEGSIDILAAKPEGPDNPEIDKQVSR